MFYLVKPPVCGEFGPQTVWDPYTIPPTFKFVHYVFDGWPQDLTTSTPVFLANLKLVNALLEHNCSGFSTEECLVSKSEYFHSEEFPEDQELPTFVRLLVQGSPQIDDLGTKNRRLIVSEKAKRIIESFRCPSVVFEPLND
jgi:hypothetical protein